MSTQSNRTEMAHFLVPQRKTSEYTSRLGNEVLYVTEGSKCWKLTTGSTDNVPELESSHEEADTRMILHAKHANGPVVIHTDDIKSKNHSISSIKEKFLEQLSPGITAHEF